MNRKILVFRLKEQSLESIVKSRRCKEHIEEDGYVIIVDPNLFSDLNGIRALGVMKTIVETDLPKKCVTLNRFVNGCPHNH